MTTYDTNVWDNCRWLQVQNHRRLDDGTYTPESRWQWLLVEKLLKWFSHKSRAGVLCFATTARYQRQDKLSPQLSNLCGDFDADSDDDFEKIANSVDFLINHFVGLNVPDEYLRVWFSGGRSFHFEIPYQTFDVQPTVELNLRWKFIIEQINETLPDGCFPFDLSLYSNPRMFRLPNSFYPKYNAYKIELAHDDIHLPIGDIRELAREPQDALYMEAGYAEYAPVWKAIDWYQEQVEAWEELEADRGEIPTDPEAIKAMVSVPLCINDLRTNAADRLGKPGTANKAQIHDATYSLAKGIPKAAAVDAIETWIHDARPDYQNTKSVVKSIYANPSKYKFSCALAWHLELNCAKEACPLYRKHDLRKHSERVRVVQNIDWKPPIREAVTVTNARKLMENHLVDTVIDGWQNPTTAITAYALPPGGGKTITALRALQQGVIGHVLYFAPRHRMLDEQTEAFPQFYRVRARSFTDEDLPLDEQLCIQPARCDLYAAKRYNAVKSVCMTQCPKRFQCDYRWQFVPRNAMLTHDYLSGSTFTEWLTQGIGGLDPPFSWAIIIDEPSISTFIEQVNVTNSTLTKAINQTSDENVRTLLEVVRSAIETVCNSGEKPVHLIGQAAFDVIVEAAKKAGVDLSELVARAREAIDDSKKARVRVEFESMLAISQKGTSIEALIRGESVWLPVSEIEIDEKTKVLTMPAWLAETHSLSGIAVSDVVEVEAEGNQSELLLNFIEDFVRCLEANLAKSKPFNSPMVIAKIAKCPTLRLNLKRNLDHLSGPVIMLDACAQPQLLSALTGRDVNTWNVPLKLEQTEIIQTTDGYYGITTLWNKQESQPKGTFNRMVTAVNRLIAGKEAETLIVTWKLLADHLIDWQAQGKLDTRVAVAWYGGIEGLNAFEDRKQVILLGTPTAPVEDIVEMGQAIWANDPTPLNPEIRYVWRRYAYKDSEGNGMEAQVWEFCDDRLNLILRTHREHEMIQAAHRIRPLLTAGKTIYLLSNLPIEELPPTQLTTLDKLAGNGEPEGFEPFVGLVEAIVDEFTGVWSKLLEHEKSSKDTFVINTISYNNDVLAKKWATIDARTIRRWLSKAVSQLGLTATQVAFGKGLSIKVWHRRGELNEAKVRNLWKEVQR